MKNLELNQMENLQGEGFWTGFSCGLYAVATIGLIAGTGGAAAVALPWLSLAGAGACGTLIGLGGQA